MILIENTVISDDIADQYFVCDLIKCKGACCVEGDMGAPLLAAELPVLEEVFEQVKPYLSAEGLAEIEKQGLYVYDHDQEPCTPVIEGRECVYAIYDEKGILKCGIEQAFREENITFQKPISCHLYPIRITQYDDYQALNYDRWHICSPACDHGKALKVPLYKFLQAPLTRAYGQAWYEALCRDIAERFDEPQP